MLRAYVIANEAEAREHEANFPRPVAADTMFGRTILAREPVQLPDIAADRTYALREGTLRGSVRAQVAVPLMRDGEAIGAINITRRQTGQFSPAQIELLQVFADQAVIAISSAETYRALQTRTADLQESLEYQTATNDVLKVISRSTFDLQPVLDTVAETAARLCDAEMSLINRRDGDLIWAAANYGYPPEVWEYWKATEPFPPDPNNVTVGMRTLLEGRVVHIHDVATVPGYPAEAITLGKQRTSLGVPLLRGDEAIGSIALSRRRIEPFTDRQIELVRTFADQAVIAIENTRLITEQREALEQQTATAEVLQVINASPGNLTPVFDAVLERALRLCGASFGTLATYDGEHIERVAFSGVPAAFIEYNQRNPLTKNAGLIAQGIATSKPVQATDIPTDERLASSPSVRDALVELGGVRALLQVPMLKDESVVGFIGVWRREPGVFPEKQIALLEGFAAQAVIAMENARLLTEQREALEQQTAMAEVLGVINASHGNLDPVFEAILERAMYLCQAAFGGSWMFVGDRYVATALHGVPDAYAEFVTKNTQLPGPGSAPYRFVNGERSVLQNIDLADDELYRTGNAQRRALVDIGGARTALHVPLRTEAALGVITLYRKEVRSFTEKQAKVLQNFAEQAVIAMENARLIAEQREALEQQTATAEVLQVIKASPGNLQPVFEAILDKAHRICGAAIGSLFVYDGEFLRAMATHGWPEQFDALMRKPRRPTPLLQNLIKGDRLFHIPDLRAMEEEIPRETTRFLIDVVGVRTFLALPLRRDRALLGTITAHRLEVRPFSEKEIALLENFAAQAVIAMENARLLDEIRQRQEELRVTFENMGDGVAMFDETQHLVAWNRNFQEVFDLPDVLLEQHRTYEEHLRFLAARGDFGAGVDTAEQIRGLVASPANPTAMSARGRMAG